MKKILIAGALTVWLMGRVELVLEWALPQPGKNIFEALQPEEAELLAENVKGKQSSELMCESD